MQLTKGAIGNLINRYKAVLKKCHLMNTFGSLAVAGMLVMGGAGVAVAAEDVPLEGKNDYSSKTDLNVNHLMGGWLVKEDTTTEATGDITLDVKGGTISEIIGGSYVKANSAFNGTLTHGTITTTIEGTTSSQFVVGGSKIANSENAYLKTGDISLTIKGGTFSTEDNTGGYELVMGGNYLKADKSAADKSTAQAGDISVKIEGGEFHASVVGGSTAHVYPSNGEKIPNLSVTDGSTSVTITGGTFNPSETNLNDANGGINLKAAVIGGGLAYGANTSTVLGSDAQDVTSRVTIDGEKIAVNGKVVAGSVVAEGGYAAVVHGNTTLTMKNGTVSDDLVGGGMVQDAAKLPATTAGAETGENPNAQKQPDHNLIVTGNAGVTVAGGTATGEIVGGNYVRGNGSARVANSLVTITGGEFASDTANKAQYVIGGNKSMAYEGDITDTLVKKNSGVLVDGAVKIVDGAVVGGSMAKAEKDGKATATVAGNSGVQVDKGTLAGVVGGGLAETYSHAEEGSAISEIKGTSFVAINGGTINGIAYGAVAGNAGTSSAAVVGGGMANGEGSKATVGNTSVTISDGTINGKVVAGGAAVNGGKSGVEGDTSLTMTGGKVDGDLIGGGFVDMNNATDNVANVGGSTYITVSDGSLVDAEIIGGGSVRNATGEANVKGSTHVTVTKYDNQRVDQQWVQYVLGGGKAMTSGQQTATANVTGSTNVTIGEQGATGEALKIEFGTVAGGGLARAQAVNSTAKAEVANANVTVHSGILSGVAGGGIAESYSNGTADATVTGAANLTINGGTINGVKYKDVDTDKVKVAVLGGGIAKGSKATADATTTNTVINGGTIKGHVVAGGLADGGIATVGTATMGTANVTNANLTINGGEINGSVYAGGAALGGGTATVEKFDVRITGGTINGDVVAGNYTGEPATEASLMALLDPRNSGSSGSISFSGGTVTGNVVVQNDVIANVIIDGTGATVTGSYQGNANSTLTFQNYNTDFNKVATGFGTLEAAAGSNVTLANLSTGAQAGKETGFFGGVSVPEITVTGEGTVTATNVNVYDSKTLTVADGGTLVAKSLTTDTNSTAKTKGLGSTLIIGNANLDDIASNSLSSTAGSEIQFTGLGDSVTLDAIKGTLATDNKGIVNVGDTSVEDLSNLVNEEGTVSYDDWKTANAAGITTNAMKKATLTGVSDDVTQTGSFGSAQLAEGKDRLNIGTSGKENTNSLTLTGLDASENFVSASDGQVAGATINKNATLTLGDNAYTGDKAIGTILIGNGTATLNVLGAGSDVATVNSGAITASGTTTTINAKNVTLNVAGHIGGDGTVNNQSINTLTADAANVIANGGDVYAKNVTLDNGLLQAAATTGDTPAGGNITIAEALSGQGAVVADKTLTLQKAYIGKEGDDLTLQADTLKTDAIDSTTGDLAIAATNLVTSKDTSLTGDTLVADNVALGGVLNASGKSLVEVGGFYTDESFETEGLNKAVSVTGQSLMAYGADLAQAQQAVAETGHTGAAYYAGKTLDLATGGSLTVGDATATDKTVAFGSDSLLVVDGTAMNGKTVFTGTVSDGPEPAPDLTASVDAGSRLHVDNAVAGNFTVFGDGFDKPDPGWTDNVTTDSAMLDASYNATGSKVTVKTNNAHTVFPNLSDGMADAVNDLYNGKLNNVDSTDMGVRFLSRATNDHYLGTDKDAAAATIESAARIAFAGAVPQMTKMASDAGTNAVVNRLGFANPADGAQAMDAEGKIVDRNTTGFALWIAPLWQSQHGWGMEADNLDYGFNGNLGGVSLGADYTFENAIRAGITFNIGGGYAESSGGDLNSTENRMSFWGLGAYAGWNYENFGLMADVSYTSTWNDLKQDMDSRMGMGDLEADVQASAISAGLRAEYKLETSVMDVIPHIGVRYMSLNTWGFDAESNGGTVLEGDGFHQDIWTFPVGVTFTKDFTLDSGWSFKPSIDFSVIPAAGDIKAKQDVAFTGLPGSYEVETQMMDYLTWQGGVGLEMGNDTMSFGVNYTLQAGQHTTGHGVFGSFRYEF
jgi:hypothetical protein